MKTYKADEGFTWELDGKEVSKTVYTPDNFDKNRIKQVAIKGYVPVKKEEKKEPVPTKKEEPAKEEKKEPVPTKIEEPAKEEKKEPVKRAAPKRAPAKKK